ncbi:DUF1330 domain-containing protein [Sphingomonas sp. GlSt437]|uniref:DUF1330 domain-containing protein n=1 Tax=Sphingomonas sp. GlSt437 TaxID=3389970 RepID=UPI003A8BF5B5
MQTSEPFTVTNAVTLSADQLAAFLGAAEDGPFVMINLLKFRERAVYADGRDPELSGRDAYLRYGMAVQAELARVGAKPGYAGPITGLMIGEVGTLWDMVALAQYPSLAAMREMVMAPSYQAIAVHREAGLLGQLNIKTKGQFA